MARAGLATALLLAGCVLLAHGQQIDVSSSFTAGTSESDGNTTYTTPKAQVAAASVDLVASKINATLMGIKATMGAVLRRSGLTPETYDALVAPLEATTTNVLSSIYAVRDAYESTLKGFFSMMLDNTKELRKTLEDGNAVIDLVNTLRGAKCEDASFEPPAAKPARITGVAGSLKITTGTCTLKRAAAPLKLDYVLECTEPSVAFDAKVPRYTSRFVSAAKAASEECKVTRKYGVESETTVTLFNAADFFSAAGQVEASAGPSSNGSSADGLGVNRAAGWFKTLFPLVGKHHKIKGGRVQLMPQGVAQAVQQAIKQATVDMTLQYKPFTIKADMIKAAENVAAALGQQFEVKQKLFKVYRDDISQWANATERAEMMSELNFKENLRESMSKLNITSLFDGMFAKTTSKLLAKSKLGGVLGNGQLAASLGGVSGLTAERPLRTLLSKAREGAGQAVNIKLQASLDDAVRTLGTATGGSGLSSLLSGAKKGSLLELLSKDKGMLSQLANLSALMNAAAGSGTAQARQTAAAGAQAGAGAAASADAAQADTAGSADTASAATSDAAATSDTAANTSTAADSNNDADGDAAAEGNAGSP